MSKADRKNKSESPESDDTVTYEGRVLTARTCKANEWFAATDLPKQRDQDYALIATCVVDTDGSPAFTVEEVGELPMPIYARLYGLTRKANRPEGLEKK